MSIGVLAHLFGKMPYQELAANVGKYGFKHVQLALWKAINEPDFSQAGKLSPGLARSIRNEFAKHDVSFSVLACYIHLYEREEEKRRMNLERFKELIRYAHCFDAPMVAVEVGKMPSGFIKSDWPRLIASLKELVEEAEKWGVFIGIQPANDHLIGDAKTLHRMLEEVPSSHIGVVLDPGNLLKEDNFVEQDIVIQEAFDLLGDRIIACHAKDRIMKNGKIETVAPGMGEMNYDLYFKLLNEYKPNVDIIMEKATPDQMIDCKAFLERTRENAGREQKALYIK